jgi:hypothetical protein
MLLLKFSVMAKALPRGNGSVEHHKRCRPQRLRRIWFSNSPTTDRIGFEVFKLNNWKFEWDSESNKFLFETTHPTFALTFPSASRSKRAA